MLCGFTIGAIGIYQLLGNPTGTPAGYPLYAVGLILLTISLLLVPFTVIKFFSLGSSRQAIVWGSLTAKRARMILAGIILLWAALLLIGYFLIGKGMFATLILPALAILGVLLPISAFLIVAWQKAGPLETSRSWGALSAGLTFSPLLGIGLEFGFMVLVFAFIMVIILQDSSLLSNLEITATRLASGQDNPEIINNILVSFLSRPVNRFMLYSIIAGLVPIVEEIAKQIPVWLLAWRKLSPRAGLMVGALGGAGFAITESLMTISAISGTEQWLYQILGRSGAGLMHICTGAIGGWGLASAMQGKSYIKAVLAYLVSVIIHGLWNATATWDGLSQLIDSSSHDSLFPLAVLSGLFIILLVFLLNIRKLIKD
jgi:hypothetical protein